MTSLKRKFLLELFIIGALLVLVSIGSWVAFGVFADAHAALQNVLTTQQQNLTSIKTREHNTRLAATYTSELQTVSNLSVIHGRELDFIQSIEHSAETAGVTIGLKLQNPSPDTLGLDLTLTGAQSLMVLRDIERDMPLLALQFVRIEILPPSTSAASTLTVHIIGTLPILDTPLMIPKTKA